MAAKLQVLFVNSPCPFLDDDSLEPPMGILMISAVLLKDDVEVEILDLSGLSIIESLKELESITPSPHIIGFSTYTASLNITIELLNKARDVFPMAITVAGGPHASAMPQVLTKHFDYVIVGEGERAFLELVQNVLAKRHSPNVIFADPVDNLDDLPFPVYELVDLNKYTRKLHNQDCLSILTSRGCTHNCTFCNSRVFSKGRQNLRLRSPYNIAKEINFLRDKYDISSIRFQDDMFTISVERIKAIMQLSSSIQYRCFARADTLTEDMCHLLASTGCYQVAVGVESGSDSILRAMHKGVTTSVIRQGLFNAHKAGLSIRIYLMVGFPGESDQTIDETKNFLNTVPFNEFVIYPTIPYPGTPLYEAPEKFGITWIDKDFSKYVQVGKARLSAFVIRTIGFGPQDVFVWRKELIEWLEKRGATWYDESVSGSKRSISQ